MKKVLFLMFLLFLCLGTASVKAQVRIGGNTAPNSAAVLDLNATDTSIGTKGLVFPRVTLTSNTMQITTGIPNLNGMLVYNTVASSLGQGVYHWNGSVWVKDNLPATVPSDSGIVLMSNGSSWVLGGLQSSKADTNVLRLNIDTTKYYRENILDTAVTVAVPAATVITISLPGINTADECMLPSRTAILAVAGSSYVAIVNYFHSQWGPALVQIRCFRYTR